MWHRRALLLVSVALLCGVFLLSGVDHLLHPELVLEELREGASSGSGVLPWGDDHTAKRVLVALGAVKLLAAVWAILGVGHVVPVLVLLFFAVSGPFFRHDFWRQGLSLSQQRHHCMEFMKGMALCGGLLLLLLAKWAGQSDTTKQTTLDKTTPADKTIKTH